MKTPTKGICEKGGCLNPATLTLTLIAADGQLTWQCCGLHADEFREWVIEETAKDDGVFGEMWAYTVQTPPSS